MFLQRSPSGYHVTSSPRKARVQTQHVLGVGFGLQNNPNLCWLPRLHTDSDLDVLVLDGKLRKSPFQRVQPHIHISLESGAVIILLSRPFLLMVLCHPILGCWAVYQVGSIRDAS
jgi:hypothetical protein